MLLAQLLSNHFKMINSRLNTFTGIIKSLILCRGCRYKDLSEEIKGKVLLDSKIKSVSRFLQGTYIEDNSFHELLKSYIPSGKLLLSIDRTTWELGKSIRNILVLGVSYAKISIPVLYKIIPYKGSCTAADQIEMIEKFMNIYGAERIACVLGDREFDNEKLITFLDSKKINYVLRIRKTNRIIIEGKRRRIDSLVKENIYNFATKFYSIEVIFTHLNLSNGERLSIVSNIDSEQALLLYKQRWDIERSFKMCKSGGFRMEDSHLRSLKRLESYIKCIFIAFTIVVKIGKNANKKLRIKSKKTLKCKMHSIFQYGIISIKNAIFLKDHSLTTSLKPLISLPSQGFVP